MKKLIPALATIGAIAVVATGTTLAAPAAGPALKVTAVAAGLKFSPSSLKAKAGKVTITLKNVSPLPHDLVVQAGDKVLARTPILAKGKIASLSVTLKAGTYGFICSVPGHAAAGMKGSLVVS